MTETELIFEVSGCVHQEETQTRGSMDKESWEKLGVVEHVWNLSTGKVETGGSGVKSHPQPHVLPETLSQKHKTKRRGLGRRHSESKPLSPKPDDLSRSPEHRAKREQSPES